MGEVFEDIRVITNTGQDPIQVWFEPWGMPHALPQGQSFRVVGHSSLAGCLEVVDAEGVLAIYGWPGSTVRVYNGEALVDDFDTVFPDLPPGMSSRSFIEFMFGGPGGPGN